MTSDTIVIDVARLRRLRKRRGLTPRKLSLQISREEHYVGRLERKPAAFAKISLQTACDLARCLGTPLAYLIRQDQLSLPDVTWVELSRDERYAMEEEYRDCKSVLTYADRCPDGFYLPPGMREWTDRLSVANRGWDPETVNRIVERHDRYAETEYERHRKFAFEHRVIACEADFRAAVSINPEWVVGVGRKLDELEGTGRTLLGVAPPGLWKDVKGIMTRASNGFTWHRITVFDEEAAIVSPVCCGPYLFTRNCEKVRQLSAGLRLAFGQIPYADSVRAARTRLERIALGRC